jgi:hypothetical protein
LEQVRRSENGITATQSTESHTGWARSRGVNLDDRELIAHRSDDPVDDAPRSSTPRPCEPSRVRKRISTLRQPGKG